MSELPKDSNEPIDVKTIHQLVRLMKKYDLTALDLAEGETKIRLRRRGPEVFTASAPPQFAPLPTQTLQAQPTAASSPPSPPPSSTPAPSNDLIIESPMVGTFYSSPSPDAPSFVTVGTTVRADSTVCVIEAMKVFTDIPAGFAGTISETLVKNGQSVEFGQPLFRVRPS